MHVNSSPINNSQADTTDVHVQHTAVISLTSIHINYYKQQLHASYQHVQHAPTDVYCYINANCIYIL